MSTAVLCPESPDSGAAFTPSLPDSIASRAARRQESHRLIRLAREAERLRARCVTGSRELARRGDAEHADLLAKSAAQQRELRELYLREARHLLCVRLAAVIRREQFFIGQWDVASHAFRLKERVARQAGRDATAKLMAHNAHLCEYMRDQCSTARLNHVSNLIDAIAARKLSLIIVCLDAGASLPADCEVRA